MHLSIDSLCLPCTCTCMYVYSVLCGRIKGTACSIFIIQNRKDAGMLLARQDFDYYKSIKIWKGCAARVNNGTRGVVSIDG